MSTNLLTNFLKLLVYDVQHPLLFNSMFFFFLFIVIMTFYPLIVNKIQGRTWYLLAFSLYFYYKTSGIFLLLLLATSLVNYVIAIQMEIHSSKKNKGWLLFVSLLWNLGTLGYFKYTNFMIDNLNALLNLNWSNHAIILPVGISFFTFQTMSYTFDVYYGKLKALHSFKDFCFFVSFFPQLVAGPIVRATWFIPQIKQKLNLTEQQIATALVLIIGGLLKKGVIADYISINFVDRIFESPTLFSGVENLMAVYAYALQIYCDFSGYSDIAIGLATLMGFNLPINFNVPYTSSSITEFWHRWHISLSTWLKDYLYIPLGGNRSGKVKQLFNLMVTMVIGGLWHGASWNFVFWGGLHGIALVLDKIRIWMKFPSNKLMKFAGLVFTFHFVCFCWIFFRAADFPTAWQVINQIFTSFNGEIFFQWVVGFRNVAMLIVCGYVFHFIPQRVTSWFDAQVFRMPVYVRSFLLATVIWILFQAKTSDIQPFIYFQF